MREPRSDAHADAVRAPSENRSLIDSVLASSSDCIKVLELDGRLVTMNPAGCRLMELADASSLVGTRWPDWWPDAHKADAEAALAGAARGRPHPPYEAFAPTSRGKPKWWEVSVSPIIGEEGVPEAVLVVSRDVTERRAAEALLKAQNRALELVASGVPLGQVLEHLTAVIEEQSGGTAVASILLVDNDGKRLRVGAAPGLPDSYNAAVDGIAIRAGLGTCADAAARADTTITTDFSTAPGWKGLSHLPLGLGFRAAWSMPILSSTGKVLGTIGTYFRERREPTARERQIVAVLCKTAALAIERRASEETARENRDRMELVVRGARVGVWYCPLPFGRLVWDETVKEHFHLGPDAEVTMDTFYERLHPDDREPTRAAIARSIAGNAAYDVEYRTVSPDGSTVKWIRAVGRTYHDAAGDPERFGGITFDITPQKAAEQSLRASEARFRTLADNIAQFAWMADASGRIWWYNQRWQDYTGLSVEQMADGGRNLVLHPDDLSRVPEGYFSTVERGEPWEDTFRLRSKDGEYRWFLSRAVPIRNDGEIVGWFGTNTDIHDQRLTAEALRRNVTTLEALNTIHLALASHTDTQAIVQTATDAATRLTRAAFGAFFYNVMNERGESYTLYTLSGVPRSAFEKFPMPRNTHVFAPTFRGESIVRSDDITKDPRYGRNAPHKGMPAGHLPVKSYLAVPVMSRTGDVIGGLFFGHPDAGVFDEHAERYAVGVAAQAAIALDNARLYTDLRRSEERYKLAARATNDAIWDWDLASDRVEWSRAVADLFGHTDAVRGTDAAWRRDHVHPEDAARVFESARAAIEDPERAGWSAEYRFRRADGSWADVLDRGTVLRDPSGAPLRMVGAMLDVTDRKRAERERLALLESERAARAAAERAGRLKDDFLATLSHELRTPLNAILGWTHLLRKSVNDPQKALRGVEVIERNARVQTQLIADLLDISRITSGKMRLDVQRVELPVVIDAALEAVRPAADAKGVRIQTVIEPAAGTIYGDPARLQQVMWNLASNAVKFTPRDGRVQIVLARVNSSMEIRVSDTGQGISPEFLPHVFDRFRQADASAAREHGGLGLGLALVKQLVEMHGGQIRAHSDGTGRGATFIVELPIAIVHTHDEPGRAHPLTTSAPQDPGDADLSGLRILVVDDEPDALDMIRRVLEEYGATVATAASADEGLRALAGGEFDALLSDVGMPRKDGYEFIAEARARRYTLPAAALTAFARSEDRTRALLAGYQSHLTKPVEAAELLATLLSLTGRAAARRGE